MPIQTMKTVIVHTIIVSLLLMVGSQLPGSVGSKIRVQIGLINYHITLVVYVWGVVWVNSRSLERAKIQFLNDTSIPSYEFS